MLAGLLTVYYVMIFIPSKIIFFYLEGKYQLINKADKYTPQIAKFGLNKVVYSKEMKRRGSWPLAYSTEFANF